MTPPAARHRLAGGLRGHGIEIGASNRPVPAEHAKSVKFVDKYPADAIRLLTPDIPDDEPLVEPDIIAPARFLTSIADASLDFVIASHVLEHIPDPLAALVEWHRILVPGGRIYLCLPDMRGTFDAPRTRTTLAHVIEDLSQPDGHPERRVRDFEHFLEWSRLVNRIVDPRRAEFWADVLRRARYPIHYHCWLPEDLPEMVTWLDTTGRARLRVIDAEEADDQSEFSLLIEKPA